MEAGHRAADRRLDEVGGGECILFQPWHQDEGILDRPA